MRLYDKTWKLYSFATSSGSGEIDLIIDNGKILTAIEVKLGDKIPSKIGKGFMSFEALSGAKLNKLVIYSGAESQIFDNKVEVFNYRYFLEYIIPTI